MSYHRHADKRTYVYRLFDDAGRLIYIGSTMEPEGRVEHHRKNMWWGPQIKRMSFKVYPDRQSGIEAEAHAIRTENPRWNINHRSYGSASWTEQTYMDFITAMENAQEFKTDFRKRRIERAKRFLEAFRVAA